MTLKVCYTYFIVGFTIEYYEDSQKKEIRAAFGSRIQHPSQVDQALFAMAKEAINALDPIKADTLYISPGSEIPSVLNSINWFAFMMTIGFLAMFWNIRISKDLSPLEKFIKETLHGDQGMDRMFFGILIIHITETLFTLCICKFWGNLPMSDTTLYMILSFFGGIFVVKAAAKRVGQIQRFKNSKKN